MALTFNGSSSSLVWSGSLISDYPLTMFAWIKCAGTSNLGGVGGIGDNGGEEEFWILDAGGSDGKIQVRSRMAGPATEVASSTTGVSTSWQPVMGVWVSNASRKVYYAAGAVVENTGGNAPTITNFDQVVIGAQPLTLSAYFAGDIAEVAFWSSALTQGNFDSLAAGALPESIAAGSLLDSWSLLTQAASQVGTVSRTLTASNTSQAATHPISRSAGGGFFARHYYDAMIGGLGV